MQREVMSSFIIRKLGMGGKAPAKIENIMQNMAA
jgi:hypothetical protein